MVLIVLRNGFRFRGRVIGETSNKLFLDDVKVGRVEILRTEIAARTEEGDWHE